MRTRSPHTCVLTHKVEVTLLKAGHIELCPIWPQIKNSSPLSESSESDLLLTIQPSHPPKEPLATVGNALYIIFGQLLKLCKRDSC